MYNQLCNEIWLNKSGNEKLQDFFHKKLFKKSNLYVLPLDKFIIKIKEEYLKDVRKRKIEEICI